MREFVFRKCANFLYRNYRLVFWIAGFFFVFCLAYLFFFPPKVETDILGLLPQKDPVVIDFKSALDDFKSIDHLFILIKLNSKDESMEDYFDDIDEYVQRLKDSGMISSVEYRIQDMEPALRDLLPYTFLYLKPGDLDDVSKSFSKESINSNTAKNRAALQSPISFYEKQLIKFDPFHLLPVIKNHFLGKTRRLRVDLSTGYYLSKDAQEPSLLILAKPVEPAQNIVFGKKLIKKLDEIEKGLKKDFPGTKPLSFSYGGGYAINQSDSSLVITDAITNTLSSFILVLLITFFSFRVKSALVFGWLPLCSGMFLTLFFMRLFGGTFNSATASIGALLIGLGIDFSTVLYGRYIHEKRAGTPTGAAIETTMGQTFKGVLSGAATTMGTFAAMLATPFGGMRQVGILVAMGIFLVVLMNFVLFPPMMAFHEHYKKRKGKEHKFTVSSFGIAKIGGFAHRFPVMAILMIAIVTFALGILSLDISIDDSVAALRSSSNQGLLVTREINKRFGASFTYMMATVYGKDPFEVARKAKNISDSLDDLKKDGRVLFTDSLATYLPPEEAQEAVVSKLGAMRESGMTYGKIEADFLSSCGESGFDPVYFHEFLTALKRMVNPEILTYERLQQSPLAPFLEKFIVKKGENLYRGVVYIYISEDYKRNEPSGLVSAVNTACPEAKVTGINRLSRTLRAEMKTSALRAFLVGLVLVLIIIYLDFRSLWLSLLSLAPLFIALIWLMGTMVILKEPLNMMNIFVTTMIIGIGSDYGIYIVHRYIQPGGKNIGTIINETCKPVIIAALTTIAGFGSLYFSSFPGLKSVGLVAGLGTLFAMLTNISFLIAVMALIERRKKKRGK
jgi:uncharacterized protein